MLKSKRRLFPFILFLCAAGSALAVVREVDPASARLWQFALLYFMIFLAVYAFVLIMAPKSRQQGALVALFTLAALLLQSQGMLTVLTGLLLLGIFVLIEFYAISR